MRLAVTGCHGQLAQSLRDVAHANVVDVEVVPLGRPGFDLARIETLGAALDGAAPDVVINAAAFTAVDKAESDADAALLINGAAAGAIATACARRNIPVIQISTEFVFDGMAARPYLEGDPASPINVYGASKLLGEQLVAASAPRHLIVRTSWVISPYGNNFAKTMLRLGRERSMLSVVDDQHGAPAYALHLAAALLRMAAEMNGRPASDPRWGVYHATNGGVTTWCGLAREIFAQAAKHGVKAPDVKAIPAADYPTPAQRPANSRLNCAKLETNFGIVLPPWQDGVRACVDRLCAPSQT